NNTASVSTAVKDTTAPTLTLSATPSVLWPPNHQFVPVTITVTSTDVCDSNPAIRLVSITSNETPDANGSGNTSPDVRGAAFGTSSTGSRPTVDCCSGRPTKTRSIGVSIGPGQIAFTRMLSLASRSARLLTNPTTPNLHIEYTGLKPEPTSPDVDAVKSRLPPPRARISGIAASVVISNVRRLRSIASSNALRS